MTYPAQSWPSFSDTTYWPVSVMTSTNSTLPGSSRGLLVVEGNFTMSGSVTWNGVILVGGSFTSNGNDTINGAMVTGLNDKITPGIGNQSYSVGNGAKTFQYNSCSVAQSLPKLGGLSLYANTWSNSWPGY